MNPSPQTATDQIFDKLTDILSGVITASGFEIARLARSINSLPQNEAELKLTLKAMLLVCEENIDESVIVFKNLVRAFPHSEYAWINFTQALKKKGILPYRLCIAF